MTTNFKYNGESYRMDIDPQDGYCIWRILTDDGFRLCSADEREVANNAFKESKKPSEEGRVKVSGH